MTEMNYGKKAADYDCIVLIDIQRTFGEQDFFDIYADYIKSKYGNDLSGLDAKANR